MGTGNSSAAEKDRAVERNTVKEKGRSALENSVVFIITHTIRKGQEQAYEEWNKKILEAVSSFPGYLGREVFRPVHGSRKYTIVVRFDSSEHLNTWVESEARETHINMVSDLLEKGDQTEIRTGIDFWFTPPHIKPPKPYKQLLITITAIYPLTLIIPRLVALLLGAFPLFENIYLRGLITSVIICGLMTYIIMPRYTQLLKRWLYEEID